MTKSLCAEAASDYLRLTLFAFDHGLIGRTHYQARLNLLRHIGNLNDGAVHYAKDLLGENANDEELFWPEPVQGNTERTNPVQANGPYYDDVDQSLAFKIATGPLKGWEFHQADNDFFPSIPHGHEHGRKQPKLDVYLGWVYNKDEQVRRVDRSFIIGLWNDQRFRDFAIIAIDYYLGRFPNYSGWRVTDPRILPSIRRGRGYR
jgi:hypothetical protein